ncbi:MAG: cytochrome c oxidase subunit II [bacterium]|nr:cytochrome c oxidase subunit II [bacterium]
MYTVGASVSEAVDKTFWFIIGISVILLLLVTFLMIFFAVKYSRKRHPKPKAVKQSMWLEVIWTLIPTLLVLTMFYYGYEGFKLMRNVPGDAMKVKVTGRMWDWSFEYANGKRTDKLYVPKGKSVKLEMKSLDVIHSFFIPAFRIKEDVVPGRETYLWFKPQTTGPADIFCAEFCGQRHAYMLSQVMVMDEPEFEAWYKKDEKKIDPMEELLKIPAVAFMDDYGCLGCHSLEGPKGEMVNLKGIFGQKRFVLQKDGSEKEVLVDEAYLKRAIMDPGAEVVKGQIDQMEPADDLTDEQLKMIIEFLKNYK